MIAVLLSRAIRKKMQNYVHLLRGLQLILNHQVRSHNQQRYLWKEYEFHILQICNIYTSAVVVLEAGKLV